MGLIFLLRWCPGPQGPLNYMELLVICMNKKLGMNLCFDLSLLVKQNWNGTYAGNGATAVYLTKEFSSEKHRFMQQQVLIN